MVRRKLIISLFWLAPVTVQAQTQVEGRQDTIYVTTQSYGDSIVVRWAPGSVRLWQIANKVGYKVERRQIDERDFSVVSEGALKPYTLREWKQKSDTANVHVATAAQMLMGEIMMQPQNAVTFTQKLLTAEEQQNRLAISLYSAEFSIDAANGLALRWVDRKVVNGARYYYRVTLFQESKAVRVIPGVTRQEVADTYTPRAVTEIEAEGKDGQIEIRWDKANDAFFSGYYLERAEDGKNFKPLESIPYKTVADKGNGAQHVYRDNIAVYNKDYHYRVRGITSFADLGAYSAVVKAQSKDLTAPAPPAMLKAQSMKDQAIKLTWTDTPVAPDHAGYFIGRGTSIHGPFEKLNKTPLPTAVREYLDEAPIRFKSNFYTIIAADKLGNENQSVVAMAVLSDYTPPGMPTDLMGDVDTLGVVSLAWKLGPEEDLMGYRVYRSNHPDQTFIQITTEPIAGNFYMDTIALNTLTKKVYYKVAAFDFNYNPSEFSEVLALNRPDYSPPVRPVIKGYSVRSDTIQIEWVPSSSKDVAKHIMYRKEAEGEWEMLQEILEPKVFYDHATDPGKSYEYAMEAIDGSGLSSGKTRPVRVFAALAERMPVTGIAGEFDSVSKSLVLRWQYEHPGDYKFVIYRGEAGAALKTYAEASGRSRNYTDNKLYLNGSGYVYALKVLFADGTESGFSEEVTVQFKE